MNIKILKKIRKITSVSIKECLQALKKNNFNLEKSIIYLKKKKLHKNKKPKQGGIFGKIKNNKGIIIKINCETDFAIKNKKIINFAKKIINYSLKNKCTSIEKINNVFKKKRKYLILKFKENIIIKKIHCIKGKYLCKYIHNNNKIGTILKIKLKNKHINFKKIKKIAMHIAAMNPKYIDKSDISYNTAKKYIKNIILISKQKNKKIIKKKIKEKINNLILLKQKFIFNNKKSISDYIKKNNIKIINFYRLQI